MTARPPNFIERVPKMKTATANILIVVWMLFTTITTPFSNMVASNITKDQVAIRNTTRAISIELAYTGGIKVDFPATKGNTLPGLNDFTATVRKENKIGLWADGLFAFQAYDAKWGEVHNQHDTASHASIGANGAYFIHNFLGGDKLNKVQKQTRVAVITADKIEWYEIDVVVRYNGTSNGQKCGYKAPFQAEGQNYQVSADHIIKTHYSQPFAIQTCICENNVGGVLILTGTLVQTQK